uniref:hypothetical protein n=1 Tax=Psychrobacter sp. TaxID=56811 RepID=UPI00159916AD|nr:hypothetical protein [Psychrobacter sp.]QJS05730.1 hypothetical protein [Psychrobacter sp.]
MILKIVISSVLALSAVNALAGTYIHYVEGKPIFTKTDDGSVIYTKKVKVTNSSGIYSRAKKTNERVADVASNEEINQAIENLNAYAKEYYKSGNNKNSETIQPSVNDYADSAYAELR